MSLDRVLRAADAAAGGVPARLLPEGFFAWRDPVLALAAPVGDESRQKRVHAALDMFHDSGRAAAVAAQLAEDYPPSELRWIKGVKWTGPEEVPLDDVDFSNMRKWNAWHQPHHTGVFVEKIHKKLAKGKHVKPAIMVQRPGHPRKRIIDGHHRSLAHLFTSQPVWAWVGHVDQAEGPWDEMHDHQLRAHQGGATDTAYIPNKEGSEAERAAFHETLEKHLAAVKQEWHARLTLPTLDEVVALAGGWDHEDRHVKTPGGVKMYHAPIGTLITPRMRKAAADVHGRKVEEGQFAKEGKGFYNPAPGGKSQVSRARKDAAAKLEANSDSRGHPKHPEEVAGYKVKGVYSHPESKHDLYDLGAGLHAEGEGGKPGPVMRSNTGLQERALAEKGWKLQPSAGQVERQRAASAAKVGAAPARAGSRDALAGAAPKAEQTAARGAIQQAVARSHMFTDEQWSAHEQKIAKLEQELQATNERIHDNHRAKLAKDLLFLGAGVLIAALTGGIASPVALAFALPLAKDLASTITDYHIQAKGTGRDVLAHPVQKGKAAAQTAKDRTAARRIKEPLSVRAAAAGQILALSAANPVASAEAKAAAVLKAALVYHGCDPEAAQEAAAEAVQRASHDGLRRMAANVVGRR